MNAGRKNMFQSKFNLINYLCTYFQVSATIWINKVYYISYA